MLDRFTVKNYHPVEFDGLFGINEFMELGWSYVLPQPVKNLYLGIKKHLGNNPTCYPSEDYLCFITGVKKKEDVEASIQFLQLFGFIFCKHGSYKGNQSNIYCLNRMLTLNILENNEFIGNIIDILKRRNFNRGNKKDISSYEKSMNFISMFYWDLNTMDKLTVSKSFSKNEFLENRARLDRMERLLQSIYNVIKVTSLDNYDQYNSLWENNIFCHLNPSEAKVSPRRGEQSLGGGNNPSEGANNIIYNIKENINNNIYDDEQIDVNESFDSFSIKEKTINNIIDHIIRIGLSKSEVYPFKGQMGNMGQEKLIEAEACLKVLNLVGFKPKDTVGGYVYKLLDKPNLQTAKNTALRWFNQINKQSISNSYCSTKYEEILCDIECWQFEIEGSMKNNEDGLSNELIIDFETRIKKLEDIHSVWENEYLDMSLYREAERIYEEFQSIIKDIKNVA